MFEVENHGSLVLIRPIDGEVRTWLEENVQGDAQWFGGALVVEPRYVPPLLQGMWDAGFTMPE